MDKVEVTADVHLRALRMDKKVEDAIVLIASSINKFSDSLRNVESLDIFLKCAGFSLVIMSTSVFVATGVYTYRTWVNKK